MAIGRLRCDPSSVALRHAPFAFFFGLFIFIFFLVQSGYEPLEFFSFFSEKNLKKERKFQKKKAGRFQ